MKFITEILSKPLFKATSLNGVSILIKISIGFITSKIIAVFVGPSGMALVGNLRNFLTTVQSFGTLGFENGIVKYVAEHKSDDEKLKSTLSTIFFSVFISCFILGLFLFFFSNYFNDLIFGSEFHYSFIFKFLALALPFYIGNIFLVATINGFDEYKKVIYINIIGNCIGLLVSGLLIWKFKIEGALLSIVLTPSLLFLVSLFFLNKRIKILEKINTKSFQFNFLKSISSYSLMALVSAVFGPMVLIAIRTFIIDKIGIQEAGFWEAITRISSYYFLFITSIIGIYFYPKMIVAETNSETKKLFWKYYKGVMPLFIFGLIIVFFLKEYIVQLLFTKEFLPVSKLFFWQLIGDVFKALSIILGYQFFAKKLTKEYIISEIFSLLVLYCSSVFFIKLYSIEGVVMAHAFTYSIYFITLSIYFRKSLFS
ncbi:O-antigen translocase [Flavobacterium sp.]|uniref:O-antigen translocase n=1 Tax=Flavobacterium sp. TaxID=239 RepID=UPI0026372920|nr:O-antigen translocase [Flavobacterium sp.]